MKFLKEIFIGMKVEKMKERRRSSEGNLVLVGLEFLGFEGGELWNH